MTNLPLDFRRKLEEHFLIGLPESVVEGEPGADGTRKKLLLLADGEKIETVRIAGADGNTICVSSQAGCRYGCVFCATGLGGFTRSLRAGEIVAQILSEDEPVRRIVFMGMGEPLANYRNVVQSIRILTHQEGSAIPPRRITVSTVGLVPLIDRLAEERLGVRLAVSLTSAIQEKRERLMPVAKRYPLNALLESVRRFARESGNPVTFEYVLLSDVNDSNEDARELARRLGNIRCKVNLIPFNSVESLPFRAPAENRIDAFLSILTGRVTATVRRSAGRGIDAACGQLRLIRRDGNGEKRT